MVAPKWVKCLRALVRSLRGLTPRCNVVPSPPGSVEESSRNGGSATFLSLDGPRHPTTRVRLRDPLRPLRQGDGVPGDTPDYWSTRWRRSFVPGPDVGPCSHAVQVPRPRSVSESLPDLLEPPPQELQPLLGETGWGVLQVLRRYADQHEAVAVRTSLCVRVVRGPRARVEGSTPNDRPGSGVREPGWRGPRARVEGSTSNDRPGSVVLVPHPPYRSGDWVCMGRPSVRSRDRPDGTGVGKVSGSFTS